MRVIICGPSKTGKTHFARLLLAGAEGGTLLLDDYRGPRGGLAAALYAAASWIVVVQSRRDLGRAELEMASIIFDRAPGGFQFVASPRPPVRDGVVDPAAPA